MPNRLIARNNDITRIPGIHSSKLAVELREGRVYPGIPDPVLDLDAVYNTVVALKEMVEILTRQRGFEDDSAATVADLNNIFNELSHRLENIDTRIDVIEAAAIEIVVAHNGLPPLGTGGGDFVNYTEAHANPKAKVGFDITTGIATIGVDGVYTIAGSLQILDGQKDESYEISIETTGSSTLSEVVSATFWNNKQEIAVGTYAVSVLLEKADTIKQTFSMTPGGDAQQFGLSSFSVELVN